MEENNFSSVSQRISRLRWQTPILAFVLVLVHQIIEHTWLIDLPRWQHFVSQMLFYGLIGPTLAIWVLTSLRKSTQETEKAESALRAAHTQLEKSTQRLEFLIRVSRKLSEAQDEDSLEEMIMELPLDVVPAVGCSLIQYDAHEQPRMALHRGQLDPEVFETWVAHLSSMKSSQACLHCSTHWAVDSTSCPLADPAMTELPVKKIYCLELKRSGHQFGILNIYLSDTQRPTPLEKELLETMGREMSLAIESMRLHNMELNTLYRVQQSPKLHDFYDELEDVVQHVVGALEISGGILFLIDDSTGDFKPVAEAGTPLESASGLVKGLAKSTLETDTPFLINGLDQDLEEGEIVRSLLVAPLHLDDVLIGCLVLWAQQAKAFSRRHIRLISTVVGQMALFVENHTLYLQAEYHAALAERARMVREIHDGLAQTLGYMQLRIAQINQWAEQERFQDIVPALKELEKQLDGAYIDAREAIDGLQLKPGEKSFGHLLEQVYLDFQELSKISFESCKTPEIKLLPHDQVHLLRIIQEALGNIRKHSQATHAKLDWERDENWLTLKVLDNGKGFSIEDVPLISHYGLRIMRERAELLGANFEVKSSPGEGTQVLLRVPVNYNSHEVAE